VGHTHEDIAVSDPEKYLSVIIDGADQSCHLLPHFARHAHYYNFLVSEENQRQRQRRADNQCQDQQE
jgi:signal transduction protein with GAF and PtsI domain